MIKPLAMTLSFLIGVLGLFSFIIGYGTFRVQNPSSVSLYLMCFGYAGVPLGFLSTMILKNMLPKPKTRAKDSNKKTKNPKTDRKENRNRKGKDKE